VLFEAGKFDEAEAQLNQAIKIDPANTAAYTYLNIIREHATSRRTPTARVGPRNACSKSTVPGILR
jgi:Tfp pilus assembly protein PilF